MSASIRRRARQIAPARAGRILLAAMTAVLLLFISFPLAALFLHTPLSTLWQSLRTPSATNALTLSLETTAITLIVTLVFGTPTAFVLARGKFPGKRVLDSIVDLPIVVPPAVAGVALLLAFGRQGLLGPSLDAIGVHLSFSTTAVILAQLFVSCPFYIRSARSGFAAVDRTLEEASFTLGRGGLGTFWRITVPLAFPGLLGGAVLTWARALGEFGATIMFAGNLMGVTQTMPLAVYLSLESGDLDGAVALSVVLVLVSLAVSFIVRLVGE